MKKLVLMVLTIILIVSLVGCSKKEKTTLETIKEKGEMTFAMTGAYPPFSFVDKDGKLVGFDIDIANAIAKEIGVEAKPVTTAWDGIIAGLTGKRFDTIIGSMAITEERKQKVAFSDPYYIDGAQLFVKSDSKINGISELKGAKIGAVTGTTFAQELRKYSNIKQVVNFDSDVDNMKNLELGRIDGLVTAKLVGLYSAKENNINIKPSGNALYDENIGIAIRKEDQDLVDAINKALKKIKEDGTYEKISIKWFGVNIWK